MFRPSIRRVFRSRWAALWWSACVLLTAWEVSTATENGIPGVSSGSASASSGEADRDPWAIDPK